MYDYGYSYGYGLIGGNTYNPLINYDWSTTTTSGLRYLKDVGSTPTYNASMYFGRGAYFNGVDQSIEHNAICSSDSVAYSFCGKQTFTSNRYSLWTVGSGIAYYLVLNTEYKEISYAFNSNYNYVLNLTKNSIKLYENGLLVINITTTDILYGSSKTIGRRGSSYYGASYLKDFYIFDRNLTEIEITQAYEQPEAFYAMAQADSTCVLNMPMCETSSTLRNYKTGIDYPITNYTSSVRDNAKNLRYGLQTCKFVRDSLGVVQSASDYLECDGVGYGNTGWIPNANEDFTIEVVRYCPSSASIDGDGNGRDGSTGLNIIQTNNVLYPSIGTRVSGDLDSLSGITTNVFHHITISYNSTTKQVSFYLDGISRRVFVTNFETSTYQYLIGKSQYYYLSKSQRRLFKVHNKVLTQEEITANFNSYRAKGLLS